MPSDCFGYETACGLAIYRLRRVVDTTKLTTKSEEDEGSET